MEFSYFPVLFIIKDFTDGQQAFFIDLRDDFTPEGDRVFMGNKLHMVAVLVFTLDQLCMIIRHAGTLLDQIIIGKIRTHPAAHHHTGGNFHDLINFWKEIPHFIAFAQGGDALFPAGRFNDNKGLIQAFTPAFHDQCPFPVGGLNGHFHFGIGGITAIKGVQAVYDAFQCHLLDDLCICLRLSRGERFQCLCAYCHWR